MERDSEKLKYKEITRRIIGAAMEVHATLGSGFQEVIYQRALEIEMKIFNLFFEREFKRIHNNKLKTDLKES